MNKKKNLKENKILFYLKGILVIIIFLALGIDYSDFDVLK